MTDPPFPHQKKKRLSDFSTFGIGGPAHFFSEARSCEQMQEMVAFAHQASLRVFILGKGSNTLFDDRGFDGLVILNRIDYLDHDPHGVFRAGSGYGFARLGGMTARYGWEGLEFAAGIPATVGGAIYMNAGANGRETADTLFEVGYVTDTGELVRMRRQDLQFGYRTSSFQVWKGAIVEGIFHLKASEHVKQAQKKILGYRLKTQPYGEKSAGCAFRNPQGCAAGQLIEACGLKGVAVGGASISPVHANFIVNTGGAKAQDVLDLIKQVKECIYQTKGIVLEEEIRLIPYDDRI